MPSCYSFRVSRNIFFMFLEYTWISYFWPFGGAVYAAMRRLKISCFISPLQSLLKTQASLTHLNFLCLSFICFSFLPFLIHHVSVCLCPLLASFPHSCGPPPFPHSLYLYFCLAISLCFCLFLTLSLSSSLSSPSYLSCLPRGMRPSWCTLHWLISATWLWPRPWRWGWEGTPMGLLAQARPSRSKPWGGCLDGKCWCSTVMRYKLLKSMWPV